MSQCVARVVSVDVDHVWVETAPRVAGCGKCDQPGGCQSGLFAQEIKSKRYRVGNDIGATLGEQVHLVTFDGAVLRSAVFAYGIPVGLLIFGAALGQFLSGDLWAINGALLGLACGLIVLRRAEHRLLEKPNNAPMLALKKMDSTTCQFLEQK
jgi:sigma-E factor negative regulatory protein RseC